MTPGQRRTRVTSRGEIDLSMAKHPGAHPAAGAQSDVAPGAGPIRESGTTRLGIYWHLDTFREAKSAYLADLDTQRAAPDSFARWIDRAITRHAALSVTRRATLAAKLADQDKSGRGGSRSFSVAATTVEAMEAAIVADRKEAKRITTRTEFVSQAVRIATTDARKRNGGALPPPPSRLPNKPPR